MLCDEINGVWTKYDAFCADYGMPCANHCIVTSYTDKDHNIGAHYDKARSIEPNSPITILKTGEHGRLFNIAKRETPNNPFFSSVVAPGTLIIMSLEANLETVHSVPKMEEECGPSSSIVFRSITERVVWKDLEKRAGKSMATRKRKRQ